ncbi:ABC transporter ATP-binding protein [Niveispirillum sp. KHB5.9]|uniref:ABC transporter ATP-binding protein n=1 Tax=Niveispirillum sp. KHB5.9 TaxID=3400269 RepID=UPI003A89E284
MSVSTLITRRHGQEERDLGDEEGFARLDGQVFRRFWSFVRPYRRQLGVALGSVLLYTLAQVALPVSIRHAVDAAVGQGTVGLDTALALFALLLAVNGVFSFLQEWLSARLAQRVIFDLRRAMFAHLQAVSLSFLDQMQVGRLMSRLQGDVNSLQEFLEQSVTALGDLFLLVGITAVLLWMDWKLGLLTLALLPVLVGIRALWLPWAQARFRRARATSSIVNAALAENIAGIRTVQEHRREAFNLGIYRRKAEDNFKAQTDSAWAGQLMVPTVDALTGAAMAIIIVVGGNAVLSGDLNVGVMVAYIFYVQRFFDPIRTLSLQYTVLQRAVTAGHRIFEVLDVPLTIQDKHDATPLGDVPPSVELRHVTFGYRPGLPVLHDIDLKVKPGQTLALVGPTGSGKSSIAALVHRFFDVWDGEVRIGGRDVRDVTQASLGKSIAMVLQDPFLFTGSILDNIRYLDGTVSRERVEEACRAVSAHDFIMRLPDGYDTQLGQRGGNLSVGQRQLISFARALVADPKILILDEATANIDSFTEQSIQKALRVLCRGRTSIIIAHRLATVRDADIIAVLRQGRIVEQGNHASLLAKGELYARLHASNRAGDEH